MRAASTACLVSAFCSMRPRSTSWNSLAMEWNRSLFTSSMRLISAAASFSDATKSRRDSSTAARTASVVSLDGSILPLWEVGTGSVILLFYSTRKLVHDGVGVHEDRLTGAIGVTQCTLGKFAVADDPVDFRVAGVDERNLVDLVQPLDEALETNPLTEAEGLAGE